MPPDVVYEILAFWAKQWNVSVSRLTYVEERGGEIWLDGKPELLDLNNP
jgi:hypothetical protein